MWLVCMVDVCGCILTVYGQGSWMMCVDGICGCVCGCVFTTCVWCVDGVCRRYVWMVCVWMMCVDGLCGCYVLMLVWMVCVDVC